MSSKVPSDLLVAMSASARSCGESGVWACEFWGVRRASQSKAALVCDASAVNTLGVLSSLCTEFFAVLLSGNDGWDESISLE